MIDILLFLIGILVVLGIWCLLPLKRIGCFISGHDWFREKCYNCGKDQAAGEVGVDYAAREYMRSRGMDI